MIWVCNKYSLLDYTDLVPNVSRLSPFPHQKLDSNALAYSIDSLEGQYK